MSSELLGQFYAVLTAVAWAFALVLFKRSGESVPPLALNLFKNAVGIVLLVVTLVAMGEGPGAIADRPAADIYVLILSGVLGIAIADTVFFHALNLCGVGIVSIVDCTYSPFAILFSFLLLGERLNRYHYIGGAFILLAVLISSRHPPPANRTRAQLILGVALGAAAMGMMALGIVFAKPVLSAADFPLIWATLIRMLFGTLALAVIALASGQRRRHWAVFRPQPVWRDAIPASVLGAYLSMILWVAGFKYARAAIVAILNQTSVVFAIVLATLILKEPFSRRKGVALALALAGVLLIVATGG